MKPLHEYNRDLEKQRHDAAKDVATGVACPCCGLELMRKNPGEILMSYPPRVAVTCVCGFNGYMNT